MGEGSLTFDPAFARSETVRQSTTLIDSFEDVDLTEWTVLEQSRNATHEVVQQASGYGYEPVDGAYMYQRSGEGGLFDVSQPGDGLPYYPEAGDTFECYFGSSGNCTKMAPCFGVQDANNYYRVKLDPYNENIKLMKVEAGSGTVLASYNGYQFGWQRVLVDWGQTGDITVEISEVPYDGTGLGTHYATLEADDSTFTTGGVAIDSQARESSTFFYVADVWADLFQQVDRTTYTERAIEATPATDDDAWDAVGGLVDDFQQADATLDEYAGDVGAASLQPLGLELPSGPTFVYSTAGLNAYPAQGDVFEARVRPTAGAISGFAWGVQDGSNYYFAEVAPAANAVRWGKVEAGAQTVFEEVAVTVAPDVWYRVEVEWTGWGDQTVVVERDGDAVAAPATLNETTWTGGGIGWREDSV